MFEIPLPLNDLYRATDPSNPLSRLLNAAACLLAYLLCSSASSLKCSYVNLNIAITFGLFVTLLTSAVLCEELTSVLRCWIRKEPQIKLVGKCIRRKRLSLKM